MRCDQRPVEATRERAPRFGSAQAPVAVPVRGAQRVRAALGGEHAPGRLVRHGSKRTRLLEDRQSVEMRLDRACGAEVDAGERGEGFPEVLVAPAPVDDTAPSWRAASRADSTSVGASDSASVVRTPG